MSTITMGSDEFILYIRKQYPECQKTTKNLGLYIAYFMKAKGFYDPNAKSGEPLCKKERDCFWETSKDAESIDPKKLPKTANQYTFNRALLPELYDYLDALGQDNIIMQEDQFIRENWKSGIIVIPEGTIEIRENAFRDNPKIRSVVIPNSVLKIGWAAFKCCMNLEKVVISNRLKIIEYGTFEFCTSLREIEIPNSVIEIEGNAFFHCENLRRIIIPDSVERIAGGAFEGCERLDTSFLRRFN